ncbi:hypothetical protein TNCT_568111 [Trichonephila clavata]|uniref:Uncharacterized protein n=1 Tax=Trichonephila clavata TaxID=2740835 RepID=A0A8X6J5G5_TRICU|nr:hypothetical protein TNCT_568111 [Trichonephila clavata]
MEKDLHFFDTSDYPKTHPQYNEINKKVLGKMKDELSSSLAIEFVGLKPKMYSLKSAEMEKKKRRKESQKLLFNIKFDILTIKRLFYVVVAD